MEEKRKNPAVTEQESMSTTPPEEEHDVGSTSGEERDTVTVPVTDEEVDKFYAIIRRIHSARTTNTNQGAAAAFGFTWKPEFRSEDFGEKEAKEEVDKTRGEERKKRRWLDLNQSPDSGSSS